MGWRRRPPSSTRTRSAAWASRPSRAISSACGHERPTRPDIGAKVFAPAAERSARRHLSYMPVHVGATPARDIYDSGGGQQPLPPPFKILSQVLTEREHGIRIRNLEQLQPKK